MVTKTKNKNKKKERERERCRILICAWFSCLVTLMLQHFETEARDQMIYDGIIMVASMHENFSFEVLQLQLYLLY